MKSNRYIRQTQLREFGPLAQEKLQNASVLVVGLGGLGIPVLQYLNAMGIGRLGLVDNDIIDETNLHRQVLYNEAEIGQSKIEVCLARLKEQNSQTIIDVHETFLNRDNALGIIGNYDLVVDASDNFPTRYLINDACIIQNKPFVYGALHGFEGQVSVFNYKGGPTYRCLFPVMPAASELPSCDENGVLGVLPGIIGNLQALEVVKMIAGIGEVLSGRLLVYNGLNTTMHNIRFSKNPKHSNICILQESYQVPCSSDLEIDALKLQDLLQTDQPHLLIDVREPGEFMEDRLESAVNIPIGELEDRQIVFDNTDKVFLICQSGIRSMQGKYILQKRFPDVKFINVHGGLNRIRASEPLV
ncbi:HesA/MoeB/ThiF family protein [Lentiprolixibacter aurantiacus]|uniref:Molybdopterin-synthase adenylyltransferase n=1 Tax=Lentiprolixibacter aurantiacus TaxID=2993939 RepID=A0AAE3MLX1_9FLAO|nr:HesA/MoeB/ThiF family protein [Lentiprolixibacter aurantiacus]MCX2719603.1 HesA/MoeB/ThiF family protein [Lentiprolixibacter aurantiacus]